MSHWFEYFPGHHMWSQGMMSGIEMQTWGAAALGEIDQIGQKLKAHVGDNEKWWQEWTAMARRIEGFGNAEAQQGHELTAGACYLRAASVSYRPPSASGRRIAAACAASAKASRAATPRSNASRCRTRQRRCRRGSSGPMSRGRRRRW